MAEQDQAFGAAEPTDAARQSVSQTDSIKPYYVLGLDPGIASCGFCLLDTNNHKILEMGAHLFSAPQEPKTKVSLAVGRRSARSMRRNVKRTRDRLSHALRLMQGEGIVPQGVQKEWFQPTKGERQLLALRAEGLDRQLLEREWARVLYSLCVRRGYIPHGEGSPDDVEKSSDDGKVLAAIKENGQRMRQGGWRTVGEMLASGGRSRNKGGDYALCVTNAQVVDEARVLFAAQRALGSTHAGEAFEQAYLECLTWQKQTSDYDERTYALVGPCTYFPELKRAAQADLTSEMLRAHERLAHISFVDAAGTEHAVPYWLRRQLVEVLFSPIPLKGNKDCKVTYALIRKEMDWTGRGAFKGVDADEEKSREPFEPRAWRRMRKALPEELLRRMLDDRDLADAVGEALTYASSPDSLRTRLEPIDLADEEVDALVSKVPFTSKIFKGYGSRSLMAQQMLLGAFEAEGVDTLYDAEEAVGLAQKRLSDERERLGLLPPYAQYDPTCRNPVVLRAMGRMRRIVNAVIKQHGVPDEIHIELGRDLKLSQKEKDKIAKSNRENEARRRRLSQLVADALGIEPDEVKGIVIRKLELWEEQGGRDAYTGNPIEFERMIVDSAYCQIDHILPYSRTCDDSRANKVLVLAKSNQDKRERSPYEWMTSGEAGTPRWDDFRARVQAAKLPQRKKAHLLEDSLDEKKQGEFINRNLNDDRYMSRAVKDYLENTLAFPQDSDERRHVYAVAGGATANLRHSWHLNYGEGDTKDRSDDRHHAVDAAVIAACSASIVKKMAEASARKHLVPKEQRAALFAAAQPWPGFADEVRAAREAVVPTRMADHGVTGQAFEETLYRFDGKRDDGKGQLWLRKGAKPSGNYALDGKGNARIVGGMAFLRLWFDPDARPKGKVKGQWYGEPVYYADMPAIAAGTYVARYMKAHSGRSEWPEVPGAAKTRDPIVVFPGDVLAINERLGRFHGVGINNANWFADAIGNGEPLSDWPPILKLGRDDRVRVVQEDVLGRCYYNLSER